MRAVFIDNHSFISAFFPLPRGKERLAVLREISNLECDLMRPITEMKTQSLGYGRNVVKDFVYHTTTHKHLGKEQTIISTIFNKGR